MFYLHSKTVNNLSEITHTHIPDKYNNINTAKLSENLENKKMNI